MNTNGSIKNNNFQRAFAVACCSAPHVANAEFHHIISEATEERKNNSERNDKSQNSDENKIFLFIKIRGHRWMLRGCFRRSSTNEIALNIPAARRKCSFCGQVTTPLLNSSTFDSPTVIEYLYGIGACR